jgi:hypothetical protein
MYEFDHMLNGTGSRQHLQQIIREAQQDRFARNAQIAAQSHRKDIAPLRMLLAMLLHLVTK